MHGHRGDRAEPDRHERPEAEAERGEQHDRSGDAPRERPADAGGEEGREAPLVEEDEDGEGRREPRKRAVSLGRIALAREAAEARREEEGEERHGERVGRVAEEERESLDQTDLEEHEPAAERGEIERGRALVRDRAPDPSDRQQGHQQEHRREHGRDPEEEQQQALAEPFLGVPDARREQPPGDVPEAHEVPEEG